MAKRKINKSELIRAYMRENKDHGPTEAAVALTKQHGVKFTPTAVSNALAVAKKGKGRKGRKHGGADGVGVKRKGHGVGNGKAGGDIFDAMKMVGHAVRIIGAERVKEAADLFSGA